MRDQPGAYKARQIETLANKKVVGVNTSKTEKGLLQRRHNLSELIRAHVVLSHHNLPINKGFSSLSVCEIWQKVRRARSFLPSISLF